MRTIQVRGFAGEGFEPLADVFGRLVAVQGVGGAALCVYRGGNVAVDLVAGDYAEDTLQLVFSVSKLIASVAIHTAVQDGRLDLDEPLADRWRELDRPATRMITLRQVMSHRSGIEGLDGDFPMDGFWVGEDVGRVAGQDPHWQPDTAHGYHAVTWGSLVQGAVQRFLGMSVSQLAKEVLTQPLSLDLWIGDPAGPPPERVSRVRFTPPAVVDTGSAKSKFARPGDQEPAQDALLAAILADPEVFNSERFRTAAIPSMNAVTDARSLARLVAATLGAVDGVRILDPATLDAMVAPQSVGPDRSLGVETAFGTGVQLPFPRLPWIGPTSFGHEGAGGSVAFGDCNTGISVGFTTNVFPALPGASPVMLGLLPTIALLANRY